MIHFCLTFNWRSDVDMEVMCSKEQIYVLVLRLFIEMAGFDNSSILPLLIQLLGSAMVPRCHMATATL